MIEIPPIKEILITEDQIKEKVKEIGRKISEDFKGDEVFLVSILRGGLIFLADLIREIDVPLQYDTIEISSYGDEKFSSGVVRLIKDLKSNIEGKNVIIVEDIVDTGRSLHYLINNFKIRNPKALKVCVLLDKVDARVIEVPIDYHGFKIPNRFVVGYGLDYKGYLRNLPFVGAMD